MAFLDLHEGILEEFSEAQGAWRARREDEQEGAFAEAKARRAERKREYMRGVPRAKRRQWRRTARRNYLAKIARARAARRAAPPPAWTPPAPVRVGGAIKQPTKVRDARPVYPPIAQSARVQGVVIIEAVIGPDGKVQEAKVLRSIPLLDAAALDAVRQWQYTPTLLNGIPVPVIMTVTVNFTLN